MGALLDGCCVIFFYFFSPSSAERSHHQSAFISQVINNGMAIGLALKLAGNPCSYNALKKRVEKHHLKFGSASPPLPKEIRIEDGDVSADSLVTLSTSLKRSNSSPSQNEASDSIASGKDAFPSDLGTVAKERALDRMPELWIACQNGATKIRLAKQ